MSFAKSVDQQGFTLIELVIVIIIASVLSAAALGLFARREDYTVNLAANQLLTSLRQAQQTALARQGVLSAPVTLAVTENPETWTATLSVNDTEILATAEIIRKGVSLQASVGTACANFQVGSNEFSLGFQGDGGTGCESISISLRGDVEALICISPSGYAYEGTCA